MTLQLANILPELGLLSNLTFLWLIMAIPVVVSLCFINAPYGRYASSNWGPKISARFGWLLMESPSVLIPLGVFIYVRGWESLAVSVFFSLWQIHYVHRAWVYPFRLARSSSPMPIVTSCFGGIFNTINSSLHGAWLIVFRDTIVLDWAAYNTILGLVLFLIGMVINVDSCSRLIRLKKENPEGYSIPHGGLFRWVSCPNYFGEIIEWFGWALLTWSFPGLTFSIWTLANLAPRARAHHLWYQEKFVDYPSHRKALIPKLF